MRGTRALWLAMAAAMAGLFLYTDFDLMPRPQGFYMERDDGPPTPSTGTAFSVGKGVWLTAQHAVNACSTIYLNEGNRYFGVVDRVVHHPTADLSLLFSSTDAEAIPIASAEETPERLADGYLFGYPRGRPRGFTAAMVVARDMGWDNPFEESFRVLTWAEQPSPTSSSVYNGFSGGPVLDSNGKVVGVIVSGDEKFGRIDAVAPDLLREFVSNRNIAQSRLPTVANSSAVEGLSRSTVAQTLTTLRQQGRIRRVICRVAD